VLHSVLERVSTWEGQRPPVVVFDLDATLFDTRTRTLEILLELREEMLLEEPELAAALLRLQVEAVDYLLTDTLRGCGITRAEHQRMISSFWHERFFSDDYIACDQPTPGAAEYVHACHEAGALVAYLTGRDIPGMLAGTVTKLRDEGFPVAVAGTELVLKPDPAMSEEAFKRGALPTLERIGEVVAVFDNEPANCNLALALYPESMVVLLDTQRVPGAPPPSPQIQLVADFRLD
jgi:phosphoglycolate phosphatase-like HAD superfamily hydrolase